jgi:FdhD protein
MPQPPVAAVDVVRATGLLLETTEDLVAVEEPLALVLGYSGMNGREQRELAVTMRTPGNDLDLALGFLFTEGVVQSVDDIVSLRHCDSDEASAAAGNLVKIELAEGVQIAPHLFQRQSFISSSCGVCGKASLDAVRVHCRRVPGGFSVDAGLLQSLPGTVEARQRVFGVTGGLHAAALFDGEGKLIQLMEDVGRHNALDKLVGRALAERHVPLRDSVLFLSGRASFELIQKAAIASIPIVCAVGAPSSLAVECARQFGITLVGFLRGARFNLYSSFERIKGLRPR